MLPGLTQAATVTTNYTYDDLNRLTQVQRGDGPVVTYGLDEVSNTVAKTITNSPDTDGDQKANFADADDDNDQMPDSWELQYGFAPLNPADALSDFDGDGVNNLNEYLANTNPLRKPGDINGDGLVSAADIVALQQHLLGNALLAGEDFAAADSYPSGGDGVLDLSDLVIAEKVLLNISSP